MPEFFFLIKLHMIKPATLLKRNRCFTVNFEKLLKALCRTPTVSASNFNSTFLTLKMDIFNRKMDIYVFHFTCLMEATSKSIWVYITLNFESSKLFLTYKCTSFCCPANQYSEITGCFFKHFKPK